MKLKNETSQNQQIHFIDGSSVVIRPDEETENLNEKKMYADEVLRVKSIFKEVESVTRKKGTAYDFAVSTPKIKEKRTYTPRSTYKSESPLINTGGE